MSNTQVFAGLTTAALVLSSFYNGPNSDFFLLCLVWVLLAAIMIAQRSKVPWSELNLPADKVSIGFLLAMLFIFLNSLISIAPNNSNVVRWTFLAGPALFLIWRRYGSQTGWVALWPWIFGFGVLSAVVGLIGYAGDPLANVSGQREDPNTFAELMLAILTPATMIYLVAKLTNTQYRLYELGLLITVLALLLTDSRAGLLVWAGSCGLILAYLTYHHALNRNRLMRIGAVFALAMVIFTLLPATLGSYNDLLNPENDAINIRWLMWQSSWELYLQRPVLGSGLGTFGMLYESVRAPQEAITSGMNPHNDYLQVLIEGGPLLLFFLLGFGLVAVIASARLFLKKPTDDLSVNASRFSLLVVVLGMLAHAMVNFTITTLTLSMFACLYLAIATQPGKASFFQPFRRFQPNLVKLIVLAVTCIPLSFLIFDTVIDNIFNPASRSHQTVKLIDPAKTDKMYRAAVALGTLRPNNIFPKNYQLQQTIHNYNNNTDPYRAPVLNKAITDHYASIKNACQPCDFAYRDMGSHLGKTGKIEQAAAQYKQAIQLAPTTVDNYLAYANFLADNGEYPYAMRLLMVEINDKMSIIVKRSGEKSPRRVFETALNLAHKYGSKEEQDYLSDKLSASGN